MKLNQLRDIQENVLTYNESRLNIYGLRYELC